MFTKTGAGGGAVRIYTFPASYPFFVPYVSKTLLEQSVNTLLFFLPLSLKPHSSFHNLAPQFHRTVNVMPVASPSSSLPCLPVSDHVDFILLEPHFDWVA